MAAFIDTDYVDAMMGGSSVRQGFFNDGSGYSSTYFTQAVATASSHIVMAAKMAGYTLPSTTASLTTDGAEVVKEATFGQFILLAYGRKNKTPPDKWANAVNLAEAIRVGVVVIPGLTPDSRDAVGAVSFQSSDENDTDGISTGDTRVPVFKNLRGSW